jgi:hypothetical protein
MAGYRQIHTQIWKDEWFIDLEPEEKLLFIYLFSNDLASISGIYRIPIKVIANETGLKKEHIATTLAKFELDRRVFYGEGTIWIVNMMKYHQSASPTVMSKVHKDADMVPDGRVKTMYQHFIEDGEYPTDTLPIQYEYPSVKDKDKDKDKLPPKHEKKPPAPFMDDPAVMTYRDAFKITPNEMQRKEISERVTDVSLWKVVCEGWNLHGWKPGNIPGLIDAYRAGGIQPGGNSNGFKPIRPNGGRRPIDGV